ncbi:MAG: vancomycin high temperature exclusion protein [Sedimentibacter sp.]
MSKFTKIKKKLPIIFLAMVVLLVIFVGSINWFVKSSYKDRIISPEEASKLNADCILVLGAGVRANGLPSPMLEDRLIQGIELYNMGSSKRLLMSGDHRQEDYDEVNAMKDYAMNTGIVSEHIFMDHAGFSTYESLYRARDIFQVKKTIIVTQKYHLYRSLYIANSLGLDAYGVASDPRQYTGQKLREVREILARVKDFLNVIIKPYPTYLGDAIPVSGNGDTTND